MLNEDDFQAGHRQDGFTLVELIIVILITSLVMGTAYTVFSSQQRTYANQQGVVDIQQNIRAGMYYLTREIRLAGYSQSDTNPDAGFLKAGRGSIEFTMDIFDNVDDDGDGGLTGRWENEVGFNDGLTSTSGEHISYTLADDATQDGLADNGLCALKRNDVNAGNDEILMENVEAIGFAFAYDSDSDGQPELNNGNIIWTVDTDLDGDLDTSLDANGDGTIGDTGALGSAVDIAQICMVRIWILVRSSIPDSSFTDSNTYQVGYNQVTANDSYRRRLLSASVVCRNMGGF